MWNLLSSQNDDTQDNDTEISNDVLVETVSELSKIRDDIKKHNTILRDKQSIPDTAFHENMENIESPPVPLTLIFLAVISDDLSHTGHTIEYLAQNGPINQLCDELNKHYECTAECDVLKKIGLLNDTLKVTQANVFNRKGDIVETKNRWLKEHVSPDEFLDQVEDSLQKMINNLDQFTSTVIDTPPSSSGRPNQLGRIIENISGISDDLNQLVRKDKGELHRPYRDPEFEI